MKHFLVTTAFVALGASVAFAQDAPRDPNQMNQPVMQVEPAAPAEGAPAAVDDEPEVRIIQSEDAAAAEPPPVDEAPAKTASFIERQEAEQALSGDLVGSTVYNAAAEALGDISDLIVEKDGRVSGVILGIGGFLGIGVKEVAIPYQAIETIPDSDGEPHLVFNVETDALEAAPDFIRLTEADDAGDGIVDDDEEVAGEILDDDEPVAADVTVDEDGDGVPADRDPDDLNPERR